MIAVMSHVLGDSALLVYSSLKVEVSLQLFLENHGKYCLEQAQNIFCRNFSVS